MADEFSEMCGEDRLWVFERVIGASLEGFDTKEVRSIQNRVDCERACLIETEFTCRSVGSGRYVTHRYTTNRQL